MSLEPGNHDIVITREKYFSQPFAFVDPDTGAVIDLTGVTAARAMGRASVDSEAAEWSVSMAGGEITIDTGTGIVTVTIPTATTSLLTTPGIWALELTGYPVAAQPVDSIEGRYSLRESAVR